MMTLDWPPMDQVACLLLPAPLDDGHGMKPSELNKWQSLHMKDCLNEQGGYRV